MSSSSSSRNRAETAAAAGVEKNSRAKLLNCNLYHEQITFFIQLYVVVLLDFLCIYKLARNRVDTEKNHWICEENTTYFTILSATLGYFLPPPTTPKRLTTTTTTTTTTFSRSIRGEGVDSTDSPTTTTTPATNNSVWNFVFFRLKRSDVVFFTQISFLSVLVLICVLQLSLRAPNCEEKTAYFIILSACLGYLSPTPLTTMNRSGGIDGNNHEQGDSDV